MTQTTDVIAALSTPPGRSGIAVLRMSGPEAGAIADQVFRFGPLPSHGRPETTPQTRSVAAMTGYTAAFGYVYHPTKQRIIDEAVIVRFTAPRSYTGEESVEFSIHGSAVASRELLSALYSAGARPAEAGEFTQRAFINGKLDLAQAEAVMNLIDAEAEQTAAAALRQLGGAMGTEIRKIQTQGIELLSEIELGIQYPEHEDSNITPEAIHERLQTIRQAIAQLLATRQQGQILQEGLSVVLLGRPNAGKSSLLNTMAGEDRAIVTDIPGTTRDLLEVKLQVRGLPVLLQDTAGLRTSDDIIEQLSMERTREAVTRADLVVLMVDPGDLPGEEETSSWLEALAGRHYIIVGTKSDLWPEWPVNYLSWLESFSDRVESRNCLAVCRITSLERSGANPVWDLLAAYYETLAPTRGGEVIVTSERQAQALQRALDGLDLVLGDGIHVPEDMVASALQSALEEVGSVTGTEITETMLDDLFARFCVGK